MQVQSNVNLSGKQGMLFGAIFGGGFACCGLLFFLPAAANGEWFGAIFAGIFMLIGLAVIGYAATVYYSRARVGKPEVIISNMSPRVGETFTVNFMHTFKRDVAIGKIEVELMFRETATYQQGTDTRTVTHNELIDLRELPGGEYRAGQMVQDSYTMQIPPDGMHTLKVRRNQLQWFVIVTATIANLPDYVDEYELTVLPEFAAG